MFDDQARATEAMLAVSRTMTAIVSRTLSDVADQITVPQLRVLVLLNTRGPLNLTTIAQHLAVNASNASRTCDQLVATGRLLRTSDPQDGRSAVLGLSADGARFVAELMRARRLLIDDVMARVGKNEQRALAQGLGAFIAAIEAAPAEEAIGLPDGQIIPWVM